jgi:hypothetical protein
VNADQEPDPNGIEARSKTVFDTSVSELNGNVRSRLTQARHAAVAELERGKRPVWQRMLVPASGLAATAIIAALVFMPDMHRAGPVGPALADDMPLLLDSDNMDMLENLEFYAWLDDDTLDDGDNGAQPVTQPGEPARS